ncbi:MAG: hypothetical protein E5V89_03885 [Mesorhizobium sp.]|nr:MAG: hypothetical protein E5V89_03885 [Mesorhizobium sp.]
MSNQVTERMEYADRRGRKGFGRRLVKLPGDSGYTTRDDAPELIAKRLTLAAMEKRVNQNGGK